MSSPDVGEKLHEELIGMDQSDARPVHPKISHAQVNSLSPEGLDFERWLMRCGVQKLENMKVLDSTHAGGSDE